jgi:hypothetical protein
MMYILTEEEFAALKKKQTDGLAINVARRQAICTQVAMTMPILVKWRGPIPQPWGCHLDEKQGDSEWPCDECPIQELCPADKVWSK